MLVSETVETLMPDVSTSGLTSGSTPEPNLELRCPNENLHYTSCTPRSSASG